MTGMTESRQSAFPPRTLFMARCRHTPALAGGYIEEMSELPPGPMSTEEQRRLCHQYRWEILGPNPL